MMDLDDVDKQLAFQSGKIERPMGQLCRHGARQKCTNCLPLDPYDADYLADKGIKHLSFHAYVRKLTDLHGKSTRLNQPLENVNYQLKQKCPEGHKPYPAGICAKCRPSTLTLMRQVWRHVDNVLFENSSVVDRFLNGWRQSGQQRIGLLIGVYEKFFDVPLGVRARVCAVYEPMQLSGAAEVSFKSGKDPKSELLQRLLGWLRMQVVGWMFTDLWTKDARTGSVHFNRNEDSFLLSSQECITAGWLQSKHRNKTQFCSDGFFGSKFVTVVVSGDSNEQVHLSGYQVSNQCMAMVDAEILCPTQENPELAWVREKPLHDAHYITEVQYSEKNEYGLEVKRNGRPMPVEYLLVDVPTATPVQPLATFEVPASARDSFPIENRAQFGELQDLASVAAYVANFPETADGFLRLASDLHFLLYLMVEADGKDSGSMSVGLRESDVEALVRAVVVRDSAAAWEWQQTTKGWKRLSNLLSTKKPTSSGSLRVGARKGGVGEKPSSSSSSSLSSVSVTAAQKVAAAVSASVVTPAASGNDGEVLENAPPMDDDDLEMLEVWSCQHCTFENTGTATSSCEMCNLPRST